ncbi:D-aspartate oxidase-like [Oppia nitens]|uniref:D-aspartate oxidase-like n=1 Tax=Oppia nitens TaxID=1686743 RepID=UPI0023DB9218|nr:D-aspartate oxidase-like [Oppia nitens]XP_054164555.1 D-aspartate oxidase-like [Oppia nitens]XP_054164556.1 D-aspartate oxidase-like [Oppia nitens]
MNLKSSKPQIGVIGGGVVGLSTALYIQQTIPSVEITVIADKFLNETLSYGAGGLFRPEVNIGTSKEIAEDWATTSYNHYLKLCMSSDANASGMQLVSGYHMNSYSQESLNNGLLAKLLPDIRDFNDNVRNLFPKRFKYGVTYTTIITDPRYYLPYLTNKLIQNNVRFINRHIDNLFQIADNYDIVVNCSGLNSKKLVNDWKLTPVRGQTIKVKAPWIKHFYFADESYVIPGRDYVTLGGIKQYGNSDLNVNYLDRESIWQRCTQVVPSLQNAEIVMDWVGLRPQRQPIRIEAEIMTDSDHNHMKNNLKVIHNYGHGGHGITYSWGTAKHATHLVQQMLSTNMSPKL